MSRETSVFEVLTVPCLSDNYAYILVGPGIACLIDAPEAGPILEVLEASDTALTAILLTHHHSDHVDGVAELRERYDCPVIGPKAEEHKLPELDFALEEGIYADLPSVPKVQILHVPGHTLGHIAYYFGDAHAAFTGDSLMALGCGRLFEGTPQMMWASMTKLMALPEDVVIYSGHEYTVANAKFAQTIEPDNDALSERIAEIHALRRNGMPTAQASLAVESATNPFLRAGLATVKTSLGLQDAPDAEVFAEIRKRKDRF